MVSFLLAIGELFIFKVIGYTWFVSNVKTSIVTLDMWTIDKETYVCYCVYKLACHDICTELDGILVDWELLIYATVDKVNIQRPATLDLFQT